MHARCQPMRKSSATGTRTRVARVRAEYPNQLDYGGIEGVPQIWVLERWPSDSAEGALGQGWGSNPRRLGVQAECSPSAPISVCRRCALHVSQSSQ